MRFIYQNLLVVTVGTAISFAAIEVNPAQATLNLVENNSYRIPNQIASVYEAGNLQQGGRTALNMREGTIIAQATKAATKYTFSTYYLTTTTDNQGYFSVAHGLSSAYGIYGIKVAVQHKNGNWHTLEFSNSVDNRFWWNSTYVQGRIGSSNFYNRPVRILLTVYP